MLTSAFAPRWLCAAVFAAVAFAVVTVWVVIAHGPTGLDLAVTATALSIRTVALTSAATAVTQLGSFPVVVGVAGAAAVTLWLRTERLLLPLTLLITVVETAAIVFLLKEVVGRDRPPIADVLGAVSTDGSFPSGHTTNGTVVYVLTTLLLGMTVCRPWARRVGLAAAVVVAVAIGLTRIYLGYHWATDVLGGWLLATAICSASAFAVCRLGPVGDQEHQLDRHSRSGPTATDELPARVQRV